MQKMKSSPSHEELRINNTYNIFQGESYRNVELNFKLFYVQFVKT